MKDGAFRELVASVRQAGKIRRGRLKAGRTTVFRPTDVQAVRAKLGACGREQVRQQYDWHVEEARLLAVVKRLIGPPTSVSTGDQSL